MPGLDSVFIQFAYGNAAEAGKPLVAVIPIVKRPRTQDYCAGWEDGVVPKPPSPKSTTD